jgi:hypothetical protein
MAIVNPPDLALSRMSDFDTSWPASGLAESHPTQPFAAAPVNDCSGGNGPAWLNGHDGRKVADTGMTVSGDL